MDADAADDSASWEFTRKAQGTPSPILWLREFDLRSSAVSWLQADFPDALGNERFDGNNHPMVAPVFGLRVLEHRFGGGNDAHEPGAICLARKRR